MSARVTRTVLSTWVVVTLWVVAGAAFAQQQPPVDPANITDDQVNAVAEQMFCLECENIPLDVCGTQACRQWRDEIRFQLAEGRTEAEILEYFRVNHGEQALAVPGDPILRGLSTVTPYVLAGLVALGGVWVVFRWQNKDTAPVVATPTDIPPQDDGGDDYLSQLERDLQKH